MTPAAKARWSLLGVAVLGAAVNASQARLVLTGADEIIYVVVARNLVERGTLDTNFYLPHSLVHQGYPHRDVHMPGYALLLAPFVAALGPTIAAPAALNLLLLVGIVLLVFEIGLRTSGDSVTAASAAGAIPLLPPYAGYLFIGLPEYAVTCLLLSTCLFALDARRTSSVVLCAVLFGAGPVLRESLLLTLPIFIVLLPRRSLVRVFLPVATATGVLAFAVFGQRRAELANDLYPAIVFDSLRSTDPLSSFAAAVWSNTIRNLSSLAEARPLARAEDAVLCVMLLLLLLAAPSLAHPSGRVRRLGLGALASFALATAAILATYAVRDAGRPWAAARILMCVEPLLLLLAANTLLSLKRTWLRRGAAAAVVATLAAVSIAQIRFVNDEWKEHDLRNSERFIRHVAPWLDPYEPRRIAVRSNHAFLYGLKRFPMEVIWPIRSLAELAAVERVLDFDFLVVPRRQPMLPYLEGNARYRHLNRHDPGGQYYIWERLY